jgi:hypothetical protein
MQQEATARTAAVAASSSPDSIAEEVLESTEMDELIEQAVQEVLGQTKT